jgi:hypothetical protein
MRHALVIAVLMVASTARADGPRWLSGPDRAYNCTHYLEGDVAWRRPVEARPGESMSLVLPVDKVMKFTLAARPARRGDKLTYALEGAPPGARLTGAAFEWKVAGAPGQRFELSLVAIEGDARARWPVSIRIADAGLFTAWSAGLGSVWPDCAVYPAPGFEVLDLDGDGKDDVIYGTFADSDGRIERHVMLQRGPMKFVEAASCLSCSPRPDLASDGTHLLIDEDHCCCILSVKVDRLDGDRYVTANSWQVPDTCAADPRDATTITFKRDARGRVSGAVQRNGRGEVVHSTWTAGGFDPTP